MRLVDKVILSAPEIVATLKRSFIPTLVIEGDDDVFIYRWIKEQLNLSLVSLLPCGGRNTLFNVYDRKDEFSNANVVFVADQDLYRFTEIPEDREGIIFTSGYCIENDIYAGSTILNFLDKEDLENYSILKDVLTKWFSFEIEKYLNSVRQGTQVELSISKHINEISPPNLGAMCPNFSNRISYHDPSEEVQNLINSDVYLNLRGKQLFQMLSRFLSSKGRFSSFTDKNLVEIALKQGANHYIDNLSDQIYDGLSV